MFHQNETYKQRSVRKKIFKQFFWRNFYFLGLIDLIFNRPVTRNKLFPEDAHSKSRRMSVNRHPSGKCKSEHLFKHLYCCYGNSTKEYFFPFVTHLFCSLTNISREVIHIEMYFLRTDLLMDRKANNNKIPRHNTNIPSLCYVRGCLPSHGSREQVKKFTHP